MKYRWLIIVGFLILIIFLAGFLERPASLLVETRAGQVYKINAELARSDEERRMGLMGRMQLKEGRGMLFIFDDGVAPVIWMKGMNFPIDIVFIGADFGINHIENNAEPCRAADDNRCDRYRSPVSSSYVLELPAGYTGRHGIGLGDKIILSSGI